MTLKSDDAVAASINGGGLKIQMQQI